MDSSRVGASAWPAQPVQVATESGKGRVATIGQFHLHQLGRRGTRLEIGGHVVMEYTHATASFDQPVRGELRRQLARVQRSLRRQALALAGKTLAAQLLEVALEQVAVDQRVAVVEGQRQPAVGSRQAMEYRQDRLGLGQPLQYGMADDQIEK